MDLRANCSNLSGTVLASSFIGLPCHCHSVALASIPSLQLFVAFQVIHKPTKPLILPLRYFEKFAEVIPQHNQQKQVYRSYQH